mgnify:CR=1 FL=1
MRPLTTDPRAAAPDTRTQRAAKTAARKCPDTAVELVLVRHGETAYNAEGRLQGAAPPGPPLNAAGWAQAELVSSGPRRRRWHNVPSPAHPCRHGNQRRVPAARHARTPSPRRRPRPPARALALAPRLQLARALARAGGRAFDRVYSSDLRRAVQTAGVVAAALGVPPHRTHQHPGLRERDVGTQLAGLTRAEAPAAAPAAWAALGGGGEIPGGGESMTALEARVSAAREGVAARHPGAGAARSARAWRSRPQPPVQQPPAAWCCHWFPHAASLKCVAWCYALRMRCARAPCTWPPHCMHAARIQA